MSVNNRSIFPLCLVLAAHAALGQGEWTFIGPTTGTNSIARDAVELQDGSWIIALMSDFQVLGPNRSSVIALDVFGGVQQARELSYPDLSIAITALVPSDTSSLIHAIGYCWDSVQTNGYGFIHYQLDQEMDLLDSARFMFDTLTNITLENATLDQDGNFFLASGASINNTLYPIKLLLMKFSQAGDSLDSNLLGANNGLTVPRQAITYGGAMMVATEGSSVGPSGFGKFLQFDDQLQYVAGFSSQSLSGTGAPYPADSVMRKSMSLYALSGGDLIVSANYGNWFPDGYRAVLGKLSGTGEPLQYFFPRSELFHDHSAYLSSIEKIDEGTFLYGMLEGLDADPPNFIDGSSPSRVHIFHMDTSFNVLCDFVVDGFADNTYYFLSRVKRTSDGGTLLIGSRQDVSVPDSAPIAWVQKLGPDDCTVGEAEREKPNARLYPNPGTNGFTLLLNGPPVNNGSIVLSDGQGRLVTRSPVQSNRAQVNAESLAAGIYFYRVLDAKEQRVASGKWVKE